MTTQQDKNNYSDDERDTGKKAQVSSANSRNNRNRRDAHAPRRSWLDGPEVPSEYEDPANPDTYAGESLGLPEQGQGSLSTLFQRMGALLIDWLLCYGMAFFITTMTDTFAHISTATMLLFALWRIITVWLFAQSPGHSIIGIGVVRVDQGQARVGLWRSVVRTALTVCLFPPVIQDRDGRGLHDRFTRTAVIRTR